MRCLLLLLYSLHCAHALPISPKDGSVEKMAFSLAQNDNAIVNDHKPSFASVMQGITENSYFKDFMSLMKYFTAAAEEAKKAGSTPATRPSGTVAPRREVSSDVPSPTGQYATSSVRIPSIITRQQMKQKSMHAAPSFRSQSPVPLRETEAFFASASMDDAPVMVQKRTSSKSILNEDWAGTLFGERGVLTGIFQMVDQQRKSKNVQADPTSKIDGKPLDLDFKKIFDQLIMGSKGEFDSSGPELPEFLGICNRLSCGDIYKAIDKFRKSEFFSNFQTAMSLVQDPNGLETLGKLLSNPELISQFTGAGSGMEEIFGSALGQAKKESDKSKDKNSRLLPEDGDFGTDFTDMEEGKKPEPSLPEIDFSVDSKPGGSSDYYEELTKGGASKEGPETDYEDLVVDVAPPTTPPPTRAATRATTTHGTTTRTVAIPSVMPKSTVIKKDVDEVMPDLSFSIDGDVEESIDSVSQTVDVAPPAKGTLPPKIHSGNILPASRPPPPPLMRPVNTRIAPPQNRVVVEPPTTRAPSTTTARSTVRYTTRTTTLRTTTKRNFRKDSDYYAMYYDEQG